MLHLWAREYPVSDTTEEAAEEAAISLRVAVDVCGGIGMDGLPLVVMLAWYSSAG